MTAIKNAIIYGEKEPVFENVETLLILIQKHNMKEESILYPMADQHQAAQEDELLGRMEAVPVLVWFTASVRTRSPVIKAESRKVC